MPKEESPHTCVLFVHRERKSNHSAYPRRCREGGGWVMVTEVSGALPFPEAQSLWKTAPCICPPQGTCLEQGTTDVRGNHQTLPRPPWTKVTQQAWLASSRYSLGLWNEAKAHAASEWPWLPSAVLQPHSISILRPECGCWLVSQNGGWKHRRTDAVRSDGVSTQPNATPLVVWSPWWKKMFLI